MNNKLKKKFRAIGHQLNPALTVASKGLSKPVLTELDRALDDHELIKVKIVGNREERAKVIKQIDNIDSTEVIQIVGGVALVYRSSREPNPALSNISRATFL